MRTRLPTSRRLAAVVMLIAVGNAACSTARPIAFSDLRPGMRVRLAADDGVIVLPTDSSAPPGAPCLVGQVLGRVEAKSGDTVVLRQAIVSRHPDGPDTCGPKAAGRVVPSAHSGADLRVYRFSAFKTAALVLLVAPPIFFLGLGIYLSDN